ncbi:MAG: serine/threonine protein kinase [Candidatus Zixiibacteriota bacterium]
MDEKELLQQRIKVVTGWQQVGRVRIVRDTSDCMRIQRGHVVRLGGHDYVIEGNRHETRFGIADQPKYWVFGAIELKSGRRMILKTVFHEEFNVHIGVFKIRCYRSPEKEARVLDLVRGDLRFMQGFTEQDEAGNYVRIIDLIRGPSIFQYIHNNQKNHEAFFHEDLPLILHRLTGCMEAIKFLHDRGTCHGDIRNDHIIIENETGRYRWIDFDLNQHVSDFDVWSMGNILNYVVGQGINSFHVVMKSDRFPDAVKSSLTAADASAFYQYRVMNLKKLFPYIPRRLNDILMHFAIKPQGSYATMDQLISDYREMLDADFPLQKPGPITNSITHNRGGRP